MGIETHKNTYNLRYGHDYFGFVYLWYDQYQDKLCIGSHFGPLDDGYTTRTGHCHYAIKKRPNDFNRTILWLDTTNKLENLRKAEEYFLDVIPDDLLGDFFYNRKKNAVGGNGTKGIPHSKEWNENISRALKGKKPKNNNISGLLGPRTYKTCEHCERSIEAGNFGKYHGDKCKKNPNVDQAILKERSDRARHAAKFKRPGKK